MQDPALMRSRARFVSRFVFRLRVQTRPLLHIASSRGQNSARRERDMSDMQFLLLAIELRTRAEEILVRATNTSDLEVQEMMRIVAAGYEKLARRAEQRVREADNA